LSVLHINRGQGHLEVMDDSDDEDTQRGQRPWLPPSRGAGRGRGLLAAIVSGPRTAQRWWVGPRYSRYGLMGYGRPRGDATTCVSHGWIYDLPTNRDRAGQCGSRGWSAGYTRHVGTPFWRK